MFFYYYGDVRTHLPSDVPRLDDFSDVGSPLKAEYLATRERFGHQGKIIQLKVGRAHRRPPGTHNSVCPIDRRRSCTFDQLQSLDGISLRVWSGIQVKCAAHDSGCVLGR